MPLKNIESRKAYSREYHIKNREAILKKHAEYRDLNREEINKIQNEKYILNKETIIQKQREYREKNPEKIKETSAKYRMANKERIKKNNSMWREKNREILAEKSRAKYVLNKEKINAANSVYAKTVRGRYSHCRNNAKRRNIEFDISFEEFSEFWQKECHYCSKGIEFIGLDRVDNSKGYILDNIVSCCTQCNFMKQGYTKEDFLDQCKRILEHQEDYN